MLEPCTTKVQSKLHWSRDLHESLGGGREGTTLCGETAIDQATANDDCISIVDIALELPPCVACAAITSIGEVVEKPAVRIRVVYAARLFVDGKPVGTPLWESDRSIAERMASDHERRYKRFASNPALSEVAPTTDICVKILRRMVVTIDL